MKDGIYKSNDAIYFVLNEKILMKILGQRPIITYEYWEMMAKEVMDKLENFSTKKANRQSKRYKEEITVTDIEEII